MLATPRMPRSARKPRHRFLPNAPSYGFNPLRRQGRRARSERGASERRMGGESNGTRGITETRGIGTNCTSCRTLSGSGIFSRLSRTYNLFVFVVPRGADGSVGRNHRENTRLYRLGQYVARAPWTNIGACRFGAGPTGRGPRCCIARGLSRRWAGCWGRGGSFTFFAAGFTENTPSCFLCTSKRFELEVCFFMGVFLGCGIGWRCTPGGDFFRLGAKFSAGWWYWQGWNLWRGLYWMHGPCFRGAVLKWLKFWIVSFFVNRFVNWYVIWHLRIPFKWLLNTQKSTYEFTHRKSLQLPRRLPCTLPPK